MGILEIFILGLVFLSELAMLAAFGYWGFKMPGGIFLKWLFGIGAPLVIAVIWGLFIAPKARFPVALPIRVLLKVLVFTLGAWALQAAGQGQLALCFLGVSLLLVTLTDVFKI